MSWNRDASELRLGIALRCDLHGNRKHTSSAGGLYCNGLYHFSKCHVPSAVVESKSDLMNLVKLVTKLKVKRCIPSML